MHHNVTFTKKHENLETFWLAVFTVKTVNSFMVSH